MVISPPPRLPISLVIPCGGDAGALAPVLAAVESGTSWPAEVLIVDAAHLLGPVRCQDPFASIVRVLDSVGHLFPGEARNIGYQTASENWIAFLDLNTLPPPHWLESVYGLSQQHPAAELVLGSTCYTGQSWLQRLFITATYGDNPIPTLPGSLVHRKVFSRLGGFLPGIRAGEDTDWLIRVKQFGISQRPAPIALLYSAIPYSLMDLIRKWFRNYSSCAPVVFHLESHKTIYFLAFNFLILFVAFNWNSLVADWRESSPFYLANITKIVFSLILTIYFVIRGLAMPLRRGSMLRMLLPLRWLLIGLLCAVIDFTKLLAFVLAWCDRSLR